MMWHRHLDLTPETEFILPAIDDIIYYGMWIDWAELREAVLVDQTVRDDVLRLCSRYKQDPYDQRYNFWYNYVQSLEPIS
ncbi:MAG: hypothetical protein LBO66_06040 [Deltaproteobacteria bacterium]|jgi:hypothetical protein|nr:hypothetical protein [Deltaproteobacteria bacterium]